MTEDEEFEILEAMIRAKKEIRVRSNLVSESMHTAVLEAQIFIDENRGDLGIMTLRKAFEMGYRTAMEKQK